MVAAIGPAASTPQGALRRCLQHQWWPLSEILTATPRGPAIDVFKLRWWPLPDLLPAPPGGPPSTSSNSGDGRYWKSQQQPLGGPPSTSSTLVVATASPAASTPRGACHRRLKHRWWLLSDLPPAPPRGPAIDVCLNMVPAARIILATPTRGPLW
jgi:hypothetical protein